MNVERRQFSCDEVASRRLLLRRFAILGAALFAPAILGSSGCATMTDESGKKKGGKTIDDMFLEPRPGEEKK